MFFSVITKNINWEILVRDKDLGMKNFNVNMGVHWKTQFLGGVHEKTNIRRGIA